MTDIHPDIPRKTADDCTLPDGSTVWVCTLNSLLKSDCSREANRWAAMDCADIVPGGARRKILLQQVKAMSADGQATILANEGYLLGSYASVLDELFPPLPEPSRGDLPDEDAFLKAEVEWKAACEQRETDRRAKEDELYEAERQRVLGFRPAARADACLRAWVSKEFREAFGRRYVVEELWRAVRSPEDHSVRLYESVDEIEGLDDATIDALLRTYRSVDGVQPSSIPTSPAGA